MDFITAGIDLKEAGVASAGHIHLPEVVIYYDKDFKGPEYRTNLNVLFVGGAWNDQISSIVVVSGQWQFYLHRDFVEPLGPVLGPGYYPWVEAVGIRNDQVSSFRCVGY